jgi:hypothetical protein
MAIADVVLWAIIDAVPLDLATQETRHMVLCHYLRMGFGWSRFLLLATLAADLGRHAGIPGAVELGRASRSTATTGAAVWFVFFLVRIDWNGPWPLGERRMSLEALHLWMAFTMITMICLVQASLLSILATRGAARLLRDTAREANGFDPWAKPAGPVDL